MSSYRLKALFVPGTLSSNAFLIAYLGLCLGLYLLNAFVPRGATTYAKNLNLDPHRTPDTTAPSNNTGQMDQAKAQAHDGSLLNAVVKDSVSQDTHAPFKANTLFSPTSTLMDPAHTSRLHRFTKNMTEFPLPKFHSCTDGRLCRFSNTCFSRHDGMMIFDVPGFRRLVNNDTNTSAAPTDEWYTPRGLFGKVLAPKKPVLISRNVYTKLQNVFFVKNMFVVNCHRARATSFNPNHMLHGFGHLFVHSSGYYDDDPSYHQSFDMVLFHQCMIPSVSWPWGQNVEQLIWDDAVVTGTITPATGDNSNKPNDAKLFLPFEDPPSPQVLDVHNDVVICGENVYQEPFSAGRYLGANPPSVIARWRSFVAKDAVIQRMKQHKSTTQKGSIRQEKSTPSCTQNLRIAVWRRTEGSALRLLTNLEDIRQLVREYSNYPLQIVTASSQTTFQEQVSLFRSFDVLVTPHGSHLANMIFSPNNTGFIEVAAVPFDRSFLVNGLAFFGEWIQSFGHLPYNNTDLVKNMKQCEEWNGPGSENIDCPSTLRQKFKQSDLIVNITILRGDLERAIEKRCREQ